MKNQRYNIWVIAGILLCCVLVVLLFPLAFDNKEIYKGVIYAAIGVVILLLMFVIKVHVFETHKKNGVAE